MLRLGGETMAQLEDVQGFYNPFAKKIPKTFKECQRTRCKNCYYSKDIPIEKSRQSDYFDYCPQRKELDKQ